jgi:hypothetical protein
LGHSTLFERRATIAMLAAFADIVDTTRYPIDRDPSSPEYVALVEECRATLKRVGSVDLEGFIRDEVIQRMCNEVKGLPSYNRLQVVTPYLFEQTSASSETLANLSENHPLRRKFVQDTHAVAGDLIPHTTLLRQVYENPLLTQFLKAVLKTDIFVLNDEFQSLNMMYMHDGCSRAWHYDGTETVITLMLQTADQGGEYEFAPFIRGFQLPGSTKHDEKFDDVAKLFEGTYKNTVVKNAPAGTLNLFNGKRSFHRIRTVYGPSTRIVAVLSYDDMPDRKMEPQVNVSLYGERVKKIYQERGELPADSKL